MYSPDGFASLACAVTNQCSFLSFQAPFVWLMQLLNGNYYLFFLLQALTWFSVIISVYLLAKEMNIKHLFLTPFILLFGSTLFIDNYVGSFENDYIAIVLFILALVLYLRKEIWMWSFNLIAIGTLFWFWFGHLRFPVFLSTIAEEMWWVQIGAWGVLTPVYILGVMSGLYGLKNKKEILFSIMILISFCFPKLWFLAIPMLLKVIDTILNEFEFKINFNQVMTCIIFGLILGQGLRVGINTFEAWNFDTSSTNCFTVNHEYLARIEGKSLYYNQASIDMYNECLLQEGKLNGK